MTKACPPSSFVNASKVMGKVPSDLETRMLLTGHSLWRSQKWYRLVSDRDKPACSAVTGPDAFGPPLKRRCVDPPLPSPLPPSSSFVQHRFFALLLHLTDFFSGRCLWSTLLFCRLHPVATIFLPFFDSPILFCLPIWLVHAHTIRPPTHLTLQSNERAVLRRVPWTRTCKLGRSRACTQAETNKTLGDRKRLPINQRHDYPHNKRLANMISCLYQLPSMPCRLLSAAVQLFVSHKVASSRLPTLAGHFDYSWCCAIPNGPSG